MPIIAKQPFGSFITDCEKAEQRRKKATGKKINIMGTHHRPVARHERPHQAPFAEEVASVGEVPAWSGPPRDLDLFLALHDCYVDP